MDRQIIYPGQIAVETDLLNTNRNTMIAIGKLAGALFGTGGVTNGLVVGPSSPAALTVDVAPGEIYQLENVDNTAYSSLPADTADAILKQGIMLAKQTLACAAPSTTGYSINYLIQATYQDSDTGAVALPYYNASNPAQAYSGPNNTGATQATKRAGIVVVSAKAGTAATTGTQTTPSPDSGYIALASVTVANGQATITSGNITAIAPATPPMLDTSAIYADLASTATGKGAALLGWPAGYGVNQPATNQFFTGNGAAIQRLNDRVFVGGATASDGAFPQVTNDWLSAFYNANGYTGFTLGGQLAVETSTNSNSAHGLIAAAQTKYQGAPNVGPIALYGVGVNNHTTMSEYVWGAYIEAQQVSTMGGGSVGLEISTRNLAASATLDPYNTPPVNTTMGLQLSCGCGVAATGQFNGTAAQIITNNPMPWNSGIVFRNNALAVVGGYAEAVSMPSSHAINWYSAAGVKAASIRSSVTTATQGQFLSFTNGAFYITGQAGNTLFSVDADPSYVNSLAVSPAATGNPIVLQSVGMDTSIDIKLLPKGTGLVQLGYNANNATNQANFVANKRIQIKDSTGTIYYVAAASVAW